MTRFANFDASETFEVIVKGTYIAICYAVVDVGEQQTLDGSEPLVWFGFELPFVRIEYVKDEMVFETPLTIWRCYENSLAEGSLLREHMESWCSGLPIDLSEDADNELNDIFARVGKYCLLTVRHNSPPDAKHPLIINISSVEKMAWPDQKMKSVKVSPRDICQLKDLPPWLVENFNNRAQTYDFENAF